MSLKMIDIGAVIELKDSLAGLIKLDFSLYDHTGRLLASSASEDPLSHIAQDEHSQFVKSCINKAILRKGFSMFKGTMNQYLFFVPAPVGDGWLILVGNSFYASAKEMEDFFNVKGPAYGLSPQEVKALAGKMVFHDLKSVSETCGDAYRLFNLLVRDSYEKNLNKDRYRRVRTIMDLFSDIDQNTLKEEGVFDILCDAIVFLFAGDTVSLMTPSGDRFAPALTKGRIKKQVESLALRTDSFMISNILKSHRPAACAEVIELFRLGCPEDVVSLHLFPLVVKGETIGLLSIFNSRFSDDDCESIFNLCRFSDFLLEQVRSQAASARHSQDLSAIDTASLNLTALTDLETLYESIVEVSSHHLKAEKASLMLPQEETDELFIAAAKGMNKWIAKSIRIRMGEGIAGKVYRDGNPMVINDIEGHLSTKKRPNYRTGSFASMPLKIGDETIGVLNLSDKLEGGGFSEADLEFLRYFISYAAIAMRSAHYYQMSEQMRMLSITDSLTELFNRRYFDNRLFEELQRATRYNSLFSLAIVDIDDFKLFNDTEGHLAGDEVLKAIANISRESLRAIDIMARSGGEEFSIIMPQTDKNEAYLVTERLRKNIKELMPITWKNFPREKITVSIGISTFPEDGQDAKTLIKNADRALYQAKVKGKDRIVTMGYANPSVHEAPLQNTS
ncbi:MAG: diguanylate cyclase [Thermodesulfovibrionales bacterium]|jgi:diguanylate cyclase (GGDEF)-like protein